MKNILNITAAFAAGALVVYYLDRTIGQYMADRARGAMATGSLDHVSSSHSQGDIHLRERVRSRMGHLVSHPRAVEVSVEQGVVRLSGQVLAKELDGLLSQLTDIPGVRKVHNALAVLNDPSGFGEVQRPKEPAQEEPSAFELPQRGAGTKA
jgi:hydrogenase maturation factor HypE